MMNCEIYATEFSSTTLKNLRIDYEDFPELANYEDCHDIVINMPGLINLRIGSLHGPKPILVEVQSLVTTSISVGCFQSVTFADACDTLCALSNVKNLEFLFLSAVVCLHGAVHLHLYFRLFFLFCACISVSILYFILMAFCY